MTSDNLGGQFTAYRGMLIDTGRAPEDDQAILDRIKPTPSRVDPHQAYGAHWSTSHDVARRFATDPNAGGYETMPARMRRFDGGRDRWGVVLEAQAQGRGSDMSVPYSEHEREVRVHTDDSHPAHNVLQRLTAHVYDLKSRETIAAEHPLGEPGVARRRSEIFKNSHREPVRSFEVPEEHWRQR